MVEPQCIYHTYILTGGYTSEMFQYLVMLQAFKLGTSAFSQIRVHLHTLSVAHIHTAFFANINQPL